VVSFVCGTCSVHLSIRYLIAPVIFGEEYKLCMSFIFSSPLPPSHQSTEMMKMTVFWDVAPCSLEKIDRRFGDAYCLHQEGDEWCLVALMKAVSIYETSVNFYQTTGRNIPENSQSRCENLKPDLKYFKLCGMWEIIRECKGVQRKYFFKIILCVFANTTGLFLYFITRSGVGKANRIRYHTAEANIYRIEKAWNKSCTHDIYFA
jgi:hypothetical protein